MKELGTERECGSKVRTATGIIGIKFFFFSFFFVFFFQTYRGAVIDAFARATIDSAVVSAGTSKIIPPTQYPRPNCTALPDESG